MNTENFRIIANGDKTTWDFDIYKKLNWISAIFDGKEVFIKKSQFFTSQPFKGYCEVKIDGVWYATTRKVFLAGIKKFNRRRKILDNKLNSR